MKKTAISSAKLQEKKPTIFFDQNCGLCHWSVDFLKKRSKKGLIHFSPLNSQEGKEISKKANLKGTDTVILLKNDKVFLKSDAVVETARLLSFPWKLLILTKIIPKSIRDIFYQLISKNRKQLSCFFHLEKRTKEENCQ